MILFFVIRDLHKTYQLFDSAKHDMHLVSLLDGLEKIAHNHAVERGLTAGYLGAPTPQKKNKVEEQRNKADQAVANLNQLLVEPWPEEFRVGAKTSSLLNHLQGKARVRQQVNSQSAPGAFVYYSTLNALALESAAVELDKAADLSLHLSRQTKDAAGALSTDMHEVQEKAKTMEQPKPWNSR